MVWPYLYDPYPPITYVFFNFFTLNGEFSHKTFVGWDLLIFSPRDPAQV